MSAVISDCGKYRYRLERELSAGPGSPVAAVIMVNPSTADASLDDATIRKLKGFGERHGWGKLIVGNLFAFRATDVREIQWIADPVGPENATHLATIANEADSIIFAWGPVAKQPIYYRHLWRALNQAVHLMGKQPLCIGAPAKCGHPKHPLMLPYSSEIVDWSAP